MSEEDLNKIRRHYKDILPSDVNLEIAKDHQKIAEKQEEEIKRDKIQIRANIRMIPPGLNLDVSGI